MHLDTLGKETFPPTLATTGEGGATAFGAHARAETVLLFPSSLRSL